MSIYSFEDESEEVPKQVERLERIGFAINQLMDAIEQDAQKILSKQSYEDQDVELGLQAELLLFCTIMLQDKRRQFLQKLGIEEIDEGDEDYEDDDDYEGESSHSEEKQRRDKYISPISDEDVAKFRRMLGNDDSTEEE